MPTTGAFFGGALTIQLNDADVPEATSHLISCLIRFCLIGGRHKPSSVVLVELMD